MADRTTAIRHQPFYEMLIDKGLITRQQLDELMQKREISAKRQTELLIDEGLISEEQLMHALAEWLGLDSINLGETDIDSLVATLVPENLARRYGAIPVRLLDHNTLLVAMADPTDIFAIDDMRMITGYEIKPVVATANDVYTQISRLHRIDETGEEGQEIEEAGEEKVDIREVGADEAPVIRLINGLISQGVDDRVSDIHFEPQEKDMAVRFRVDGVLHEITLIPKHMQSGVLSRLKIMSDLDIAEKRRPQDGRIGLIVGGKPIDMRTSSMPTVHGEKVVLRILDKSSVLLDLSNLGFEQPEFERFEFSFRKPYGAILVTGPTGSGKSTTLYATLNVLNTREKNIITIEDPVEYQISGINQIQINPKAGLTFASGLRSILRADPDIIMIGEIRDSETAKIAIEAALTGHLVLSTLHTKDAAGAISRLTEMGIEPFLTASAVECVVAQRLARKLCDKCKEQYLPEPEILLKNGFPMEILEKGTLLYRANGCNTCNHTGYKGRIGIFEVMPISQEIERLTVERRSADEISRVAQEEGMRVLRQDGIEKVVKGITSIEEVIRVVA